MAAYRIRPSPILQCAICELQSAKYRCPRCDERTCSLPCSRKHKASTGCTGTRDRVAFIALREFCDQDLLNDFSFLEEVSRVRDRSTRDQRMNRPKCQTNRLLQACNSRQVKLRVMASGMARRRKNRSLYDQAKSRILWTVEFVFAGEHLLRHRVDENMTLNDVFEKMVGNNLALRHRFSSQQLTFLLAPPSTSSPFRRLPRDESLKEALSSSTIIEFPVIHIVPDSDLSQYAHEDSPELPENRIEVDLGFQSSYVPIQAVL